MQSYSYPAAKHARRHGPRGYFAYESYRPWLRDEFSFRCIYCLIREQWGRTLGAFDIDHFLPQVIEPNKKTEYENLVYSCARCNAVKSSQSIPDPLSVLIEGIVQVLPDGFIETTTTSAEELVEKLDLHLARGPGVDAQLRWKTPAPA